jgi:RNA polymerase sigma factor (sigma-70 family)
VSKADTAPEEPWREALIADDPDRAWDLFIGQYRALIFATIRHYAHDHDEVMDMFAEVCGSLRHDKLARLQKYWNRPTHTARFSSWLVTVVRHQVIDWLRQHAFRQRPRFHAALSPLQRHIVNFVFVEHRSHVETYELVRSTFDSTLTFSTFVRELRATYCAVDATMRAPLARELAGPSPLAVDDTAVDAAGGDVVDPAVILDTRQRIIRALSSLEANDRLALEMFVVHEMPAAAVARALRWPNAKAVYNRVYRALGALRANLERQGLGREDL